MGDCQAVIEPYLEAESARQGPAFGPPPLSFTVWIAAPEGIEEFSPWGGSKGYDSLNRITSYNDGTVNETYALLGITAERTSKTSNGTTTTYLHDGPRVISEYENGTLARQYLTGYGRKDYIDERLARYNPTQAALYYTASGLHSIASLTNTIGTAVERYKYEAFGNRTIYAPDGITPRSSSSYGNHVGYDGRSHDDTGLIDDRWRMIDPNLGRFLERDPIGYKGSKWNLYEYVHNDPTNWIDPLGLDPCCSDPLITPYRKAKGKDDKEKLEDIANTIEAMQNEMNKEASKQNPSHSFVVRADIAKFPEFRAVGCLDTGKCKSGYKCAPTLEDKKWVCKCEDFAHPGDPLEGGYASLSTGTSSVGTSFNMSVLGSSISVDNFGGIGTVGDGIGGGSLDVGGGGVAGGGD